MVISKYTYHIFLKPNYGRKSFLSLAVGQVSGLKLGQTLALVYSMSVWVTDEYFDYT